MIWVVLVVVVGCASSQSPSSSQTTVSHNGEWYMEEGINAFARDDYDQSIMLWEKAKTLMPRNARLANFIGLAHLRRGHDGKASLAFENAIAFDAGLAEAYNNLGYVLFRQRQYDQAMDSFQRAFAIDPEYVEARRNFKLALEASSGNLDGWAFTLAEEAVRTDDLDQKIALFSHALEVDSTYAMIHNNLGVALYYNGELQQALAELRQAVEIDPGLEDGWFYLAVAYSEEGRKQDAWTTAVRGLNYNRSSSQTQKLVAQLWQMYRTRSERTEALATLKKIFGDDAPKWYKPLGMLGTGQQVQLDPGRPPTVPFVDWRAGAPTVAERREPLIHVRETPPPVRNLDAPAVDPDDEESAAVGTTL